MDVETIQLMDEKLSQCKENCTFNERDIRSNVEKKLSKEIFFWVFAVGYTILSSVVGMLYGKITAIEKNNTEVYFNLSNRLTAIETNTANTTKQIEQLQKVFANYEIKIQK